MEASHNGAGGAPEARLGLTVPHEWWPAPPLLKSFEAAGFGLVQIDAPPASVLVDARTCSRHAAALRRALDVTELCPVLHAPPGLLAGAPDADRAFEGLLAYAAEIGASHVVYHAHALPDHPASEDRLLSETRSLARLGARAEQLGVTIALENLAPLYPGPELLSHTPLVLRTLAHRLGSERIGLCLDLGHAHVAAELKHTELDYLVRPVIDSVVLFHAHDNLGARHTREAPPWVDPLRLDLHLAPGRGKLPWEALAPLIRNRHAPVVLEVHPPRPEPDEIFAETVALLGSAAVRAAELVPAA
jgi:sugar phosphate isomerase/epimerase